MKGKMHLKKYIILVLITLFFLLLSLEVYARYKDKHESGRHVDILYKEKIHQVEQFLADKQEM